MNISVKSGFTFFLLMISVYTFSQEYKSDNEIDSIQFNRVNLAINIAVKQNSITPVDSLLESKQITLERHIAKLYYFKATFLEKKYELKKYKATTDTVSFQTKAQEILKCFDLAIKKTDCINKSEYEHGKYLFLFGLIDEYRNGLNPDLILEYKSIKKQLKDKGLHPERFGIGMNADYHIGRKQWLGVGFSLFSQYTPKVKYKSMCNGNVWEYAAEESAFGMNLLTFNYAHALNVETGQVNDFSFSLIDVYAPFRLIPTKFGFFKDLVTGQSNYYYRPGIGLSLGFVSVSYSYNIMFDKDKRATSEKGLLNIEINYPIFNWNEPRWKD